MGKRRLSAWWRWLVSAIALGALVWLALAPPGVSSAATADPVGEAATRTVTVDGRGEIWIEPDVAMVSLGVETMKTELAAAQQENATQMASILASLTRSGIAEQDVQTSGYNILPQYEQNGVQPTGYRVTNTVRATIRDLTALGATLDAASAASTNRVLGITFDRADKSDALARARTAAVRDARAKAEQYAALAGGTLGAPLHVTEGASTARFSMVRGDMAQSANTPIVTGENMVAISVQITYELRE